MKLHWINALPSPRRRHRKPLDERQIFPFLRLPLELRILIYQHVIADQEYDIGHRHLPSLLRTNLQITREIYQICPIVAIYELIIPDLTDSKYIPRRLYLKYPGLVTPTQYCHWMAMCFRLSRADFRAIAFNWFHKRKGLTAKVQTQCSLCVHYSTLGGFRGYPRCWYCTFYVEHIMRHEKKTGKKLLVEFC